jgi:hypothetical protein
MSQAGWYHDKAAECDRQALACTHAATRELYIKERDTWRAIAVSIDAEEAVKRRFFHFVQQCKFRADVRYWPKAGMTVAPHTSAFGGKADMVIALRNVR